MKILVISDSHNKTINKLDLSLYDYIFHCGDILFSDIDYFPLYPNLFYVRGNCDYNSYPLNITKTIANFKIFVTHSNIYNTKYCYDDLINNTINKYDIVLFGHTHKQTLFKKDNTIYLNPGAFKNNEYAHIIDDNIYLLKDNVIIDAYSVKKVPNTSN